MKQINLLIVILFIFPVLLFSQQDDSVFKEKKSKKEAENFLVNEMYTEAIPLFEELHKFAPDNNEYTFNLGICAYEYGKDYGYAISCFEQVLKNSKNSEKKNNYSMGAYFYLGKSYHNFYMFDNALNTYKKALEEVKDPDSKELFNKEIIKTQNALALFNSPVPMIATRLGVINSEFDDHTPIPTNNEDQVFFTSRRYINETDDKDKTGKYFEDIWVYDRTKGMWSKPENLGFPINTVKQHDATCGLSPDGTILFMYRSIKNGDIYMSERKDNVWQAPTKLSKKINTRKTERHATITDDGKTLYFSSDRRGGKGGRDIWISHKDDKGEWGKPENFVLNTEFDEEAPFLVDGSKTLYFSSRGYKGMGEYDIYKTVMQEDGSWGEPQNIGFPVNTVGDDVFYFPINQGFKAYYTRRNGTKTDIYIAYLYEQDEDIILMSGIVKNNKEYNKKYSIDRVNKDTTFYAGDRKLLGKKYLLASDSVLITGLSSENGTVSVRDTVYFVPNDENISVIDVDNNRILDIYRTNSNVGDYVFVLFPDINYKIFYDAPEHVFDTENVTSQKTSVQNRIKYDAVLVKIEEGKTEKYKETPFDANSDNLVAYTDVELNLIENCLKKYPQLYVSFSTETTLSGKKDELSERRKQKAVEYLTSKGIDQSRIYTDLSPRKISTNSMEYTIYDELSLQKAIEDKVTPVDTTSEVVVAEVKAVNIDFLSVLFDFDKHNLQTQSNAGLDKLAEYLKQNPDAAIEIVGYTDAVGSPAYNIKLSQRRAKTVSEYMKAKGVKAEQIEIKAYGEENPIAINQKGNEWYEDAKKYNRRIEVNITKQGRPHAKINYPEIPKDFKNPNYNARYKSTIMYSIQLESLKDSDKTKFTDLKGVDEKKDEIGFVYYYGNFSSLEAAEKELQSIIAKYPNAFIFVNDIK